MHLSLRHNVVHNSTTKFFKLEEGDVNFNYEYSKESKNIKDT